MSHTVTAILTGKVAPFRGPREPSAIAKSPRDGPVAVGPFGLEGDEQADLSVHGGRDKALHHYPFDHYPFWRDVLGEHPLLAGPGAFGENISTLGMVETGVCIGDRYRLGSALVEVSQGRQPCWKQGHRLSNPAVTAQIVHYRLSGWYYRVIEPGQVAARDTIALVDRPLPQWTVERTFGLLIAGEYEEEPAALQELAALEVLADSWRLRAARLLGET